MKNKKTKIKRIEVFGRYSAKKFFPEDYTLMIGILDSKNPVPVDLKHKDKITYLTYIFDDIKEPSKDYFLLNQEISRKILKDFQDNVKNKKTLAIHCTQGISRSPAVAKALTEIFRGDFTENIDMSSFRYSWIYNQANSYVYQTLRKTFEEMNK